MASRPDRDPLTPDPPQPAPQAPEDAQEPRRDRAIGALLGLAVGDALGTTLEFAIRDSQPEVRDVVGGGPFDLLPGQWTDDTSMALCLATSLAETGRFDPRDQLDRYLRWWRQGYLSSTGVCFDIGNQTRNALLAYDASGEPYRAVTGGRNDGNGSLMRLAPIPIAYADDADLAATAGVDSSRTTHPSRECVDACAAVSRLMVAAIGGMAKADLIAHTAHLATTVQAPAIAQVLSGSYLRKTREEISSSGYVVHSLEAALWAFARTDSFEEGAILAVNLGDDADTVGAIYGQIAGAHYGRSGIPARWREVVYQRAMIEDLAVALLAPRNR